MNHAADHTYLADEQATEAFGAALAALITPGFVIWLTGDLGAGKTTLTRGLLRALGHTGSVKSPTYTLLEIYSLSAAQNPSPPAPLPSCGRGEQSAPPSGVHGKLALYHFDFYRFNHPDEFIEAGLEEYFGGTGACLVEWADKALPYVAQPDLDIHLQVEGAGRRARIEARSPRGHACLTHTTR